MYIDEEKLKKYMYKYKIDCSTSAYKRPNVGTEGETN